VSAEEAEQVVRETDSPYPRRIREISCWQGARDAEALSLQINFVTGDDGTVFVSHGRELTNREKRRYRTGRR
jgi:hypothetical protein